MAYPLAPSFRIAKRSDHKILVKDFRQAAIRGLGVAVLSLKNNPGSSLRFYQAILDACTRDTRYDGCEEERAPYLYELISFSTDRERLEEDVINALLASRAGDDREQLFRLAGLMAQNGNTSARDAIYHAYNPEAIDGVIYYSGSEEIITVDGAAGLLYIAEPIGSRIASDPGLWAWVSGSLLRVAGEQMGEEQALEILRGAAKTNRYIQVFLDSAERERQSKFQDELDWNERRPKNYDQLKIIIDSNTCYYGYPYWGLDASPDELELAAHDLLREDNQRKLEAYLQIFFKRPFPLGPSKIIDLACSKKWRLSQYALTVLANLQGEEIRRLAEKKLDGTHPDYRALALLQNNFRESDFALIETIRRKYKTWRLHYINMYILDIFEKKFPPGCLHLLLDIYRRGWCSLCRSRCIEILLNNGTLPDWIAEEALYDCDSHTREIVRVHIGVS